MNIQDLKRSILSMQNDNRFQKLSANYSQKNLFNILKIERNENRHSAFLCWLLNPQSNHALGAEPIKKLLALYAYVTPGRTDLDSLLLSGNYSVEVDECTTEKLIRDLSGSNEKDRIDIWMRIEVIDNDGNRYLIPLAIENKIYAGEGKEQTERYHKAMKSFKETEQTKFSVEIFLTPDKTTPSCGDFTNLTYQQLLDFVIEPLTSYIMPNDAKSLVNAYINTLGTPATKSSDEEKDPTKLVNTIMAISKERRDDISTLYDNYKTLIDAAVSVVGSDKAVKIMGRLVEDTESAELLQNFWDCNISLFNTILYVCRSKIAPNHDMQLMEVFKKSRRDTGKYRVEWDVNGRGTDWRSIPNYSKPMSKGKAVAVFFMQWMKLNPGKSIDEVRAVFPTSINAYYCRSKKAYDSLIWHSTDEVHAVSESGFSIAIKDALWDFYPIAQDSKSNNGCGLGYGQVWDGSQKNGVAMIAKMWRKDDFDRLLNHIKNHSKDFFARVRIVPIG